MVVGRSSVIVGNILILGLLAAGCGGSGSKSQRTKTSAPRQEHVPTVSIALSSPAFRPGRAISARYTCDGADISPTLRWGAIPKGTVQLVLIVSDLEETAPGGGELITWAVAGLSPATKGIAAGRIPPGAIVGRNSLGQTGYTICPPTDSGTHHYLVDLYALPHPIAVSTGFPASELVKAVSSTVQYKGATGFSYRRE